MRKKNKILENFSPSFHNSEMRVNLEVLIDIRDNLAEIGKRLKEIGVSMTSKQILKFYNVGKNIKKNKQMENEKD